jgi:hypothetical protein
METEREADLLMNDYQEPYTIIPRPAPCAYVPFCTDALPEPIQSYVRGGAKAIGCEDSYVALPMLSALAAAVGNTRRIRLKKSWSEPAVLWTGIIGDSGSLKSPAIDLALDPLRKKQAAALDVYNEAKAAYQRELAAYEMQKTQRKKGMPPPEKPVEPVARRYCCGDVTVESLADLLKDNSRGLLLVRDELAGWLRSFNSYKKGGGDEAAWLELHGARTLLVDRKSGNPKTIYVPHAAVSICGGIQPGILQQTLGREHFENGLAARLLLAFPPRTTKRWNEHDIDLEVGGEVESVFEGLLWMEMAIDADGNTSPKKLPLMPEAQDAWVAFYDEHAAGQAELAGGDLAAAFAKLEGYCARLALVIHCVRAADHDTTLVSDEYIDAESVGRAVRIVRWFCDETRRIYAQFGESDQEREQRALLEIVRSRGGRITVRELMQSSRAYRGSAEVARFALEELQQLGWGRYQKVETGGRPRELFVLYEGALEAHKQNNQ